MDAIVAVARRHGLKVLEDAAQAHGSTYRGRPAGSLGDAAAFSFYPGKTLGACGEAGAVTTQDPDVCRQVQLLRDHGRGEKYLHVLEGYNGRMDAIQAGFLSVKLKRLEHSNEQRRRLAAAYDAGLNSLPDVRPMANRSWNRSSRHLYVVRSSERDRLRTFLRERGIGTGVHYPIPLHLQPCYRRLGLEAGMFPYAERLCSDVLSLPMFPTMEPGQLRRVITALHGFHERRRRQAA
jgi:dTDP-4-amino-4,6-dideoxygalactose transaminase